MLQAYCTKAKRLWPTLSRDTELKQNSRTLINHLTVCACSRSSLNMSQQAPTEIPETLF